MRARHVIGAQTWSAPRQRPLRLRMPPPEGWRCIDCWEHAACIAKLSDWSYPRGDLGAVLTREAPGTPHVGRFVALCVTHYERRRALAGTAGARPGGRYLGWDVAREVSAADFAGGPIVVHVGPSNARIRAEVRRGGSGGRCPCHRVPHRKCPEARPCIDDWCGRLTTAHEAPACGYCARCSAGNVAVLMSAAVAGRLVRVSPGEGGTHTDGGGR